MAKQGYNKIFNKEDWENVNKKNIRVIDDYKSELRQNKKSPKTILQYYNDWRIVLIYILHYCENKYILELKKNDFREFSLWIQDNGASPSRHNRQMSSLRSLLDYCENENDYKYELNVATKVKSLKKEIVRPIVFLTNEQVMKLIDRLILMKKYQQATAVALAYDSVGRKNELFQVEKDSFYDDSLNQTNIVVGKRSKKFELLYFSKTKECAKLYLDSRGEDDIKSMWIYQSKGVKKAISRPDMIYDWFKSMSKLLSKMEEKEIDFNVHSFRHSGIENMENGTHYICKELGLDGGVPVDEIRLLCNHKSIETTMSYLKDKSKERLHETFKIKNKD